MPSCTAFAGHTHRVAARQLAPAAARGGGAEDIGWAVEEVEGVLHGAHTGEAAQAAVAELAVTVKKLPLCLFESPFGRAPLRRLPPFELFLVLPQLLLQPPPLAPPQLLLPPPPLLHLMLPLRSMAVLLRVQVRGGGRQLRSQVLR